MHKLLATGSTPTTNQPYSNQINQSIDKTFTSVTVTNVEVKFVKGSDLMNVISV